MNQSIGARYGIWGVDPNTEKMEPIASPFEHAMKTTKNVQDLFGNYYQNKIKGLDAGLKEGELQEMQSTLPQKIASLNAKYGADTENYPLQQAAKTQQEQQTIKEIMSRTGLNYTQAKVAMAHLPLIQAQTEHARMLANPMSEANSLLSAYNNAPAGSQQKGLYELMLKNMVMGKGGKSGGGTISAGALDQLFPGTKLDAPQWEKDSRFGTQRSGMGGTYTNPETGKVISTPTTANTTRNQAAIQAIGRVTPLIDTMVETLPQFQGAGGKLKLGTGTLRNFFGGSSQAPEDYAKGEQAINLAAESMLKGLGLNVTDESLNTMKSVMKPKLGETKDQYRQRLLETTQTLQEDAQQAKQAQAQGFDVTQKLGGNNSDMSSIQQGAMAELQRRRGKK